MARITIERPTLGFAPGDQCVDIDQNFFDRVTGGDEVIESIGTAPFKFLEGVVQIVPIGGGLAHLGPAVRGVPRQEDSTKKARVAFGKFPQPLAVFVRESAHRCRSRRGGFHAQFEKLLFGLREAAAAKAAAVASSRVRPANLFRCFDCCTFLSIGFDPRGWGD